MLTVEGRKADRGAHQFLYQGISSRPFRRQFNLAEYVQVKGASLVDGCSRSSWCVRSRKQ
jgi:molecular chaperone IbpA